MRVFGYVEGILDAGLALDHVLYPRHTGVLVGTHIHDVVVALVLYGSAGVVVLDGLIGSHEVLARSGLVAKRPDDNARVVDVGMHHLHVACHMGVLPLGRVRERLFAIVILVALNVALVLQIEAVLVGEVVPVGVVAVVREAHVVDVALLHEHYLMLHLLA